MYNLWNENEQFDVINSTLILLSLELKIRQKSETMIFFWHSGIPLCWALFHHDDSYVGFKATLQWMIMITALFTQCLYSAPIPAGLWSYNPVWCSVFCFNLSSSPSPVISLQTAVILTQSAMAVWTVLMTLLSAPPSTLTSLKWTPVMMDLVQVGSQSPASFSLFHSQPLIVLLLPLVSQLHSGKKWFWFDLI